MKPVEIVYRCGGVTAPANDRPGDAAQALRRLNDGSRVFADLFTLLGSQPAPSRRIIPIVHPLSGLSPPCWVARMRVCRSS